MNRWDIKFLGDYLVQVYDLGDLFLTYDKDGDIIFMDKDSCETTAILINSKSIEDATLLGQAVIRLADKYSMENNAVYVILQQLVECSKGITKLLGVTSGTKLSKDECKNLNLASARILGCSVIGIGNDDKNELVIMRKGREERLGDMTRITKEHFISLYNTINLAYQESLGISDMQSFMGILIETLCAEAGVQGVLPFINHANYFNETDADTNWVHELEKEYVKLHSLDESFACLLTYVKIVLYDVKLEEYIKGCKPDKPINRYGSKSVVGGIAKNSSNLGKVNSSETDKLDIKYGKSIAKANKECGIKDKFSLARSAPGYSHLNQNDEAFKARVAWFEENYGENWREIIKISNPTENQFTELKEHLNIVLSTIVFDATKLIHSGLRPKCKENTMKSLYSEIFKPVLVTVLITRLSEETRTVITEELAKYFEVIPKDAPQYMNIFPNQGLAPDGGKYR